MTHIQKWNVVIEYTNICWTGHRRTYQHSQVQPGLQFDKSAKQLLLVRGTFVCTTHDRPNDGNGGTLHTDILSTIIIVRENEWTIMRKTYAPVNALKPIELKSNETKQKQKIKTKMLINYVVLFRTIANRHLWERETSTSPRVHCFASHCKTKKTRNIFINQYVFFFLKKKFQFRFFTNYVRRLWVQVTPMSPTHYCWSHCY